VGPISNRCRESRPAAKAVPINNNPRLPSRGPVLGKSEQGIDTAFDHPPPIDDDGLVASNTLTFGPGLPIIR